VTRLSGFYLGICLTTEEKSQKNLSQGSPEVLPVYLYHAGVIVIRKRVRINLNLAFSFALNVLCK
jgi:hypothetical protein